MPELVLLLVGAWHEDECKADPDFHWCRAAPNLVWLGRRSDEEAARLILCADVGILPFRVEPFNDAGLPYRILKYARLGRRTVSPELAGVHTWDRAVTTTADADAFVAALHAQAGTRARPDRELRAWALEQTAERVNAPLWERLRALGVV
jgi:glycosyltransferase involved in cell wall biosynthesis